MNEKEKAFDAGFNSHRTGAMAEDFPGFEDDFEAGRMERKFHEFG